MLRHYRRGGFVARLSVDRYWWLGERRDARLRRVAPAVSTCIDAGLPVPRPVAARYRRRGLVYSADLLMERIPETRSLAALAARGPAARSRWEDIGRCLRRFHHAGFCHADLNAHNVLLDGTGQVWLIDFDRGRLRRPGLWCDANLVRLLRSLQKIAIRCRRRASTPATGARCSSYFDRGASVQLAACPARARARAAKLRRVACIRCCSAWRCRSRCCCCCGAGCATARYWRGFGARFGFGAALGAGGNLWVHAVSVGEVQAAAALVAALRAASPARRWC